MNQKELYTLGIDIGSTTVKIAILDENPGNSFRFVRKSDT